jgi:hypothetical protein
VFVVGFGDVAKVPKRVRASTLRFQVLKDCWVGYFCEQHGISRSPVAPDPEKPDKFLEQGGEFFSWNKGKNTPNILLNLAERISSPPFPIPPEARHDARRTFWRSFSVSASRLANQCCGRSEGVELRCRLRKLATQKVLR